MARVTWIVVADSSRARIFEAPGLKLQMREIEDLVNVVRSANKPSPKEREKFARLVADHLERGRLNQRYQRLRLAVDPRFLGMLREHLSDQTRQMIFEEIDEDLSMLDVTALQAHLQQH